MARVIFVMLFLSIRFLVFSLIVAGNAIPQKFPVYDALLYVNKPCLSSYGLKELTVIYAHQLWQRGEKKDKPNIQRIKKVAKKIKPGSLVCIDIEHWPLTGDSYLVHQNISKYKLVASTIKKYNPEVKVGFYGILPIRDIWRAVRPNKDSKYLQWINENNLLLPLADSVDVVFPSLYTFYKNQDNWKRYAIENLKEAKKFGKPVYAFLWPQFHNSSLLRGKEIPRNYWRLQLQTSYDFADGIVLWGGWHQNWNDKADWWLETKSFLELISSKKFHLKIQKYKQIYIEKKLKKT